MSTPEQKSTGLVIGTVTAWIAIDKDGHEGILAMTVSSGLTLPLIGADRQRIESFRAHAEMIHMRTGLKIKLVRFSRREIVEELPS